MSSSGATQTLLITGGSAGLGYACAKRVLLDDPRWQVVITSPSAERAANAATALAAETGATQVSGMALELASQRDIRAFAAAWRQHALPPLHGIVCNAGVQLPALGPLTAEGIERIFGVNHLGHFLLCNVLARELHAPGRIVFVSSSTHDPARRAGVSAPPHSSAEQLAAAPSAAQIALSARGALKAYAASKLCNVLCAYELDRRLRHTGLSGASAPITVNCFDPGLMPGTSLARLQSKGFQFLWSRVLPPLSRLLPGVNSADTAGRQLARLVTGDEWATLSGRYVVGNWERPSSMESRREDLAAALWQDSARLTGLTPAESPLLGA